MTQALAAVVAEHVRAINAFDVEAILATFSEDAYVNDAQREIVGMKAIRGWIDKEIVGDRVTVRVQDVRDHYGDLSYGASTTGITTRPTCPGS